MRLCIVPPSDEVGNVLGTAMFTVGNMRCRPDFDKIVFALVHMVLGLITQGTLIRIRVLAPGWPATHWLYILLVRSFHVILLRPLGWHHCFQWLKNFALSLC